MKVQKKHWMLAIGAVITVAALWSSTRGVQLAQLKQALSAMDYRWLAPAFVAFYVSMYLRGVRWGLLFRPHFTLNGRQMFSPTMIGFGFNSIFPMRVGEVARAYYVGRRLGPGLPRALATVVAERIIDGMTLMGFLSYSLWRLSPLDPTISVPLGIKGIIINSTFIAAMTRKLMLGSMVLTAGLIIFMIPAVQRLLRAALARLPLGGRVHEKIDGLFSQFTSGFHALHRPSVLLRVVVHSLLIWGLVAWSNQMVGRSFGLPMTVTQGAALMTLIGLAIMIPATPGYWGPYEAGAVFSMLIMGLFGRDAAGRSAAFAFALVVHLLQYLPIVAIGLYCAWRAQLKPAALHEPAPEAPTARAEAE